MTPPTNNAGGPYNDEQAKHTRPEHDPRRWAELEPCEQNHQKQ